MSEYITGKKNEIIASAKQALRLARRGTATERGVLLQEVTELRDFFTQARDHLLTLNAAIHDLETLTDPRLRRKGESEGEGEDDEPTEEPEEDHLDDYGSDPGSDPDRDDDPGGDVLFPDVTAGAPGDPERYHLEWRGFEQRWRLRGSASVEEADAPETQPDDLAERLRQIPEATGAGCVREVLQHMAAHEEGWDSQSIVAAIAAVWPQITAGSIRAALYAYQYSNQRRPAVVVRRGPEHLFWVTAEGARWLAQTLEGESDGDAADEKKPDER